MTGGLRHGKTSWLTTPLAAVATLCGLHGFILMVEWDGWLRTVIIHLALVTATVMVLRRFTFSRVLPSLGGLLVGAWLGIVMLVTNEAGARQWLPSPSALRAAWALLADGIHTIAVTPAPAAVNQGLLAIIVSFVTLLFLIVDHIVASWRAAVLGGAFLLLPWMPAIALHHTIDNRYLWLTLGCWLLMLATTRRATGASSGSQPASAGIAVLASLGIAAVAAPMLLGAPGWGAIPQWAAPEELNTPTRLNLELDLRQSLQGQSSSPVIVYLSSGGAPDTFQLYTLAEFDGNSWSRDDEGPAAQPPRGVLWSNEVQLWESRKKEILSIQVLRLAEKNLPLPPVPREVEVAGDWQYAPEWDELASSSSTTQDLAYLVTADLDYFTKDLLLAAGAADGEDQLLDPRYLEIADGMDEGRLGALAEQLTGDQATRYDKAIAIQEYLRNPEVFTYDQTVAPSGDDYVSTFLDTKQGYCVQFATTMVMLSRSAGIPARLAVGFLPGVAGDDGTFVVKGSDAHAWPELYFEGLGWVRFEPTPSVQTGARPVYADPGDGSEGPSPSAEPSPSSGPSPDTSAPPSTGPTTSAAPTTAPEVPNRPADAGGRSTPWVAVGIGLALAAAIGLGLVLARRQRRRPVTIEESWNRLRDAMPAAARWDASLTPAEALDHARNALADEDLPLAEHDDATLAQVAAAVEQERYAPEGSRLGSDAIHLAVNGLAQRLRSLGRRRGRRRK